MADCSSPRIPLRVVQNTLAPNCVRCAVGVGTEQDDLFRPETLGNLACEPADHAHGYVGPAIPSGRPGSGGGSALDLQPVEVPIAGRNRGSLELHYIPWSEESPKRSKRQRAARNPAQQRDVGPAWHIADRNVHPQLIIRFHYGPQQACEYGVPLTHRTSFYRRRAKARRLR
jgi:hypothetical protein